MPFKPPRAADVQKCVRAGGKHNDLDAIGRTARHLSFFEMLGNWSFGDYFKAEAIRWAWELLTGPLGLDGDRLWVTVHVSDDDAEQLWIDEVGFPAERIQRLDKDNFWEMGDVGPCGPSSEIFWDYGADARSRHRPGRSGGRGPLRRDLEPGLHAVLPPARRRARPAPNDQRRHRRRARADAHRHQRRADGVGDRRARRARRHAPAASPDGASVTTTAPTSPSRCIADHTRTVTFLVNDGVVPSNEDRGYVLRRIIRRAVRYAHLLGAERLVTPDLVADLRRPHGRRLPRAARRRKTASPATIQREEEAFRRTLKRGAVLLDARLAELPAGAPLPGDVAFDLYETFGFPLEVTEEVAEEAGVGVDREGYAAALGRRPRRSPRPGAKQVDAYANLTNFQDVLDRFGPTEFVGPRGVRDQGHGHGRRRRQRRHGLDVPRPHAVLRRVRRPGRRHRLDHHRHRPGRGARHHLRPARACTATTARIVEGTIEPGQEATAAIDVDRRDAIRRNHTGTHVLHWALRQVLGDAVKQQGSLVVPRAPPLRLRSIRRPHAGADPRDRGPRQRRDPLERAGAPLRDHQGRGRCVSAPSPSSATSTATSSASSRPARTPPSCAAAPTCAPSATSGR